MKIFLYSIIWLIFSWGSGYTFYIFSWEDKPMAWWHFPHLFTLSILAVLLVILCAKIEESSISWSAIKEFCAKWRVDR